MSSSTLEDCVWTASGALGILVLISILYKVVDFIWLYFLRPSSLRKYLRTKSGLPAWALVTGASDGIGKAIASELAGNGFNVVLHGRNPAKLTKVQNELQSAYPRRSFRILVADATRCELDTVAPWLEETVHSLQDVELKVLVNNVGCGASPPFGPLELYDARHILATLHLNAAFPTLLTAALIPTLVKNGPSVVHNICSLSDNGLPLVSFYGASKSYCHTLSLSVEREMEIQKQSVEVLAHRVGLVTETQHDFGTEPYIFGPSARTMARAVLARTGCGRKSVIPYWAHGLQQVMLDVVPGWISDRIMMGVMKDLWVEQEGKKQD